MDKLAELLVHYLPPSAIPEVLTALAVYGLAPLLPPYVIEKIKTDRLRRLGAQGYKRARLNLIQKWLYQFTLTVLLAMFVGRVPGVWDLQDAFNHALTSGIFSCLTVTIVKSLLKWLRPEMHDSLFFAEKAKRRYLRSLEGADPDDTYH